VVPRARWMAPWCKILEIDPICNFFRGKGCPRAINALRTHRCPWIGVISSCAKDMAKFMGWSAPLTLTMTPSTWGYDALDLVMTSWTKQEGRERKSRQIPRQNMR
jgi:hypothetical protein